MEITTQLLKKEYVNINCTQNLLEMQHTLKKVIFYISRIVKNKKS